MSPEDDDDDNNPVTPPVAGPAQGAGDDGGTGDDDVMDMKLFASMFDKKGIMNRPMRHGEKDFEPHGTRAQDRMLEASRAVLEDMLMYTRTHSNKSWMRGWFFPDWWAEGGQGHSTIKNPERVKDPGGLRDRVVVVETSKGQSLASVGVMVAGIGKDQPGFGKVWLLPEEALHLVERGSLDLWWPSRTLAELMPPDVGSSEEAEPPGETQQRQRAKPPHVAPDDYDAGLPLSLEAAYSFLVGYDGGRGTVSLSKYQVYAHLKRAGYHVQRASGCMSEDGRPPKREFRLLQWLLSMMHKHDTNGPQTPHEPYGPLVRPGLYRSYSTIYQQLGLGLGWSQASEAATPPAQSSPFRVFFHAWAADGRGFAKANPRAPDFRFAVVDTLCTRSPTVEEITALLASTPLHDLPAGAGPDAPGMPRGAPGPPGKMYQRLKNGRRSVEVAVVDRGLVNFIRFSEAAFAEEKIWQRLDERRMHADKAGKRSRAGGAKKPKGK